jgi:hypothetical protein
MHELPGIKLPNNISLQQSLAITLPGSHGGFNAMHGSRSV